MDIEEERLEYNSSKRTNLRTVKGCTRTDQLRNEDTRNELGVFLFVETLQNIKTNGKSICKGWNTLAFHFKPINILRLLDGP
jgi:hypothetical protein